MKRLSYAEMMRPLERHGWSVVRRGKHPIYGKLGVSGTVPVPDHGKKTLADAEEHHASRRTDRGRLVANSKGAGMDRLAVADGGQKGGQHGDVSSRLDAPDPPVVLAGHESR